MERVTDAIISNLRVLEGKFISNLFFPTFPIPISATLSIVDMFAEYMVVLLRHSFLMRYLVLVLRIRGSARKGEKSCRYT